MNSNFTERKDYFCKKRVSPSKYKDIPEQYEMCFEAIEELYKVERSLHALQGWLGSLQYEKYSSHDQARLINQI